MGGFREKRFCNGESGYFLNLYWLTSRQPSSRSRTGSRFLPAICNSPGMIHPSAHATRMKVRPSLSTVPHGWPWAAASNAAENNLALCDS